MSASQTIVLTLEIKELVTEFMPKMAKEYLELRNVGEELAGTEFTMTIDISGEKYSYVVKNGTDFDITEGALDNPMVYLTFSLEDIQELAQMRNIDMLLSMQDALSKAKYDVLAGIKGTATFIMSGDDGKETSITATFNGLDAPNATFRLSMENAKLLTSKETNPVNLFMNGTLKIEGDMAFAMGLQPLMT